jgi:hypothetical protein
MNVLIILNLNVFYIIIQILKNLENSMKTKNEIESQEIYLIHNEYL